MFPFLHFEKDSLLKTYLRVNGFFTVVAVFFIFLFLLKESIPAFQNGIGIFLFDEFWHPTEGKFYLLPMVVGSLLISCGAVFIALPLSFFAALCVTFYTHPSLSWVMRRGIELYAGIPSVIFGFWGLMKLVPLINQFHPPGQSLLAGVLLLALMIFPLISLNLIAGFELSSLKYFYVAESLGVRKSIYIWKILLPTMKKHLFSSIVLALGRGIGETMAILMVCGNIVKMPTTIFDPVRTLTSNIALEMAYAMDVHRATLFLSGLILLVMMGLFLYVSDRLQVR